MLSNNAGSAVPRLRERKRGKTTYYLYDTGGKPRKEIPLGTDYGLAILEYAKLEKSRVSQALTQEVLTFAYVAELYMKEVVPTKAHATQKDKDRDYWRAQNRNRPNHGSKGWPQNQINTPGGNRFWTANEDEHAQKKV